MPPPKIRPLHHDDFLAVFEAFRDAFSDYVVPFNQSPDELAEMLIRRGYVPDLSLAAFEEGRIVAFTLTGRGPWRGRDTAYDTGTGVIPTHRRRGLGAELLQRALPLFRQARIEQVLLEVLSTNEPAYRLYGNLGFRTERRFTCWSADPPASPTTARPIEAIPWEIVEGWLQMTPSWQNSRDSILRARTPPTLLGADCDGTLAGYAVVFASGDLPQLAVHPRFRRQGLGGELLRAARATAGRPLRILNVDADAAGIDAFLRACGAKQTVEQWEMGLAVPPAR